MGDVRDGDILPVALLPEVDGEEVSIDWDAMT
jgi:hypothetical protein